MDLNIALMIVGDIYIPGNTICGPKCGPKIKIMMVWKKNKTRRKKEKLTGALRREVIRD